MGQDLLKTSWVGSQPDKCFKITTVLYYTDDILYTFVRSTFPYPEVWIRLVTSNSSMIKVVLDQEQHPGLDDGWLNVYERLPSFTKDRDQIVGRVKGPESKSVQIFQYSEEDLVMRKRAPNAVRFS